MAIIETVGGDYIMIAPNVEVFCTFYGGNHKEIFGLQD